MNEQTLMLESGEIYKKGEVVLQKKAKIFYTVEDHPELFIMRFLDVVTSDDGREKEEIPGKGQISATISNMLFDLLHGQYLDFRQTTPIKSHYLGASLNDAAECLVMRMVRTIPLEVIVRNQAYGTFASNYGVKLGTRFEQPTCEFTIKDDARNDPLIARDHIWALGIATSTEIEHMRAVALAVNQILIGFFKAINIELIDFKLVFGRCGDAVGDFTNLRIIGEISPDTCRLRDMKTGKCLDKDIFRRGLSGLSDAYATVSQKMSEYRHEQQWKRYGVGAYDESGFALK